MSNASFGAQLYCAICASFRLRESPEKPRLSFTTDQKCGQDIVMLWHGCGVAAEFGDQKSWEMCRLIRAMISSSDSATGGGHNTAVPVA
jgi:hypothetical protein